MLQTSVGWATPVGGGRERVVHYRDAVPQTSPPNRLETASFSRRFLALLVDWLACYLVVMLGVGGIDQMAGNSAASFYVMGLFIAESWLFTVLMGGSFGKLATRLRVVRMEARGGLDPLRALARPILVCLVIPPLVFRPDGRGLHDMALDSRVVTL